MRPIACKPKALTPSQEVKVLRRSIEINPANADHQRVVTRTPTGRRGGPRRLAVVIGHRWPESGVTLSVQFLDNPSRELRRRLLEHMNAWSDRANVQFVETSGTGQVRLARLKEPENMAGYWSYVGTEILGIEEDQPTMNLEGFTMRTAEEEFRRVVRHEAGHTLGFEHDTSATQFAQHFYWALAQGMTIGQATREARIAVNYTLEGDIIDWAVPVVYARDPNMKLCVRADLGDLTPLPIVRRKGRRSVDKRPFEVAVWDIDSVFPALSRTLERMTAAQPQFGFDLVDISAPIDAWDLENKAEDGTPYLWAERLAKRLGRMTLELQVNVLACVTRHWLRSDDYLNIYGWWPGVDDPPVLIFSCAGFEGLAPEGPETDRTLANAMVSALAGYLGQIDTHERGAKDCPMAFNPTRDLKHMVELQAFDRSCRAKLRKKISQELPALEVLLKAFH
jgi:hypothetical protein